MSEHTVSVLSRELNISLEQANALWLKTRQSMWESLQAGHPVDLGFAYLNPTVKKPTRRYDFSVQSSVMVPELRTLRMLIPPHALKAMAGAPLSPFVWMTRRQLKELSPAEQDELRRQGNDFYQLKGVSS